jgi:hypothetical protein
MVAVAGALRVMRPAVAYGRVNGAATVWPPAVRATPAGCEATVTSVHW